MLRPPLAHIQAASGIRCHSALVVLIARAAYRNGECPYEFRAVDTWTSSDNG